MKRRKQETSEALQATPANDSVEGASSEFGEPGGTKSIGFPVVGIGSSAGGLEAAEQFLSHLPSDSGMGFVLVSHLDPLHKSSLPELLARHTHVEVLQAKDGVKVAPNCLYVIPPNCYLSIEGGTLRLTGLDEERAPHMAIDRFLRSLAEDQRENSVAVILSGNGTDGTLGLRAINGAGGITLVQAPETAAFDGMPRSAISTGLVNFVLTPDEMPRNLIECIQRLAANRLATPPLVTSRPEPGSPLQRIHALLRARTGSDFSRYKRTSVSRRIGRRMSIHRLDDLADYARFLQENPEEVQLLFRDLLISVTSFFRDPEAFEVLKNRIFPSLLADKPDGSLVRVWVPGCATGEEAYSVAIVLKEYMEEQNRVFNVQIFATDLDHEAISRARQGRFPSNIAADVSAERLKRFFEESESGHVIKKEIREWLVLSEHNVIRDAPFMKLDLLSCRNLLIYLELEVQDQLLPLFHFALRPGGVLFLGNSESIGNHLDLFNTIEKKWKFFQRRDLQDHRRLKLPVGQQQQPLLPRHADRAGPARLRDSDILDRTARMLLERFSPPCVVTTDKGEVLYIHGRIGKYLEPAPGRMSTNIVDMAREGLRFELQRALGKAVAERREHVCPSVTIKNDSQTLTVRISAQPFGQQDLIWIIFQEAEEQRPVATAKGKPGKRRSATREGELALELERTRESLRTTIDELQASNEELRAANEELQSANEEHQSTNEELETSKEELQSLNEELLTLNSELSAKVDQASRAESDLKNLLNGLKIGVVFLDTQMRIVRYTPEATRLIKLIPSDIGRPIGDLVSYLPDLARNAAEVLDTLVPKEVEVETAAGEWFLTRIIPYRTLDNVITGLVLTFDDMTTGKRAADAALLYAESIVQTVRQPFLVLDSALRVRTANNAFLHLFKGSTGDTIGQEIYQLGNGQWDIPSLRSLLQRVLTSSAEVHDYLVEHSFPMIGSRTMLLNAHAVHRVPDGPVIFLSIEDVTAEQRTHEKTS